MRAQSRGAGRGTTGPGVVLDRRELGFWRGRVAAAMRLASTPCFVFAAETLAARQATAEEAFARLPVRHWWSFKTLPLRAAVRWWQARAQRAGVEVVSEFEWQAAAGLGFATGDVLLNGPAKHTWLPRRARPGMRVNFDSLAELRAMLPLARRLGWHVGIRVSTTAEDNFEFPGVRAQFGILGNELEVAARLLQRSGLTVETLHFHLRTNVPEARYYREAALEAMDRAAAVGWAPSVLDLGGGFPPPRVATRRGALVDASFSLASLRQVLVDVRSRHPSLREFWLENGRWLTAPGAVLAVRVLDVKEGRGARTLICDGGRTLHAMVATWERHAVAPLIRRGGPRVRTLLCGPTCMAFDNLGDHALPSGIRAGDVLLWFDAGAYQTSWETRFSHGLAAVVWTEGDSVEVVRPAERFEDWLAAR